MTQQNVDDIEDKTPIYWPYFEPLSEGPYGTWDSVVTRWLAVLALALIFVAYKYWPALNAVVRIVFDPIISST